MSSGQDILLEGEISNELSIEIKKVADSIFPNDHIEIGNIKTSFNFSPNYELILSTTNTFIAILTFIIYILNEKQKNISTTKSPMDMLKEIFAKMNIYDFEVIEVNNAENIIKETIIKNDANVCYIKVRDIPSGYFYIISFNQKGVVNIKRSLN